jgi:hypothetical protein
MRTRAVVLASAASTDATVPALLACRGRARMRCQRGNNCNKVAWRPSSISSDTPRQQELRSGTESPLDGGRGDVTCKA